MVCLKGSVNGPKFFNLFINDLFYLFIYTSVCNLADDTTPFACDMDLANLIRNLENDVASVIQWFNENNMILNQGKCHCLVSGPKTLVEQLSIQVGEQVILESIAEKLLVIMIDKKLRFSSHVRNICKKAGAKVTALHRLANIMPFKKKRILLSSFIESQFSYCPLLLMFCSRALNDRINRIQERALRLVYLDYTSSFEELLEKDNSVTIHQRNIRLLAIEMFKAARGLGPEIMREIFVLNNNPRSERSFQRPSVKSVHNGKNSICYFGPIVWDDMVPEKLKSIQTMEEFKAEIKKWVPTNCSCFLCKQYIAGVGYIDTFE